MIYQGGQKYQLTGDSGEGIFQQLFIEKRPSPPGRDELRAIPSLKNWGACLPVGRGNYVTSESATIIFVAPACRPRQVVLFKVQFATEQLRRILFIRVNKRYYEN